MAESESIATVRKTRLPRSAETRQDFNYAILIRRVYPLRVMGDAFEGRLLRPGSTISESELWPEPDYPKRPLIVEYAGSDRSGKGHRRSHQKYVLWLYDSALPEWVELARASAVGIEWVEVLKPVALRNIANTNPTHTNAVETAARVLCFLDAELEPLESDARSITMGLIYEQFTARLVRARGRHA